MKDEMVRLGYLSDSDDEGEYQFLKTAGIFTTLDPVEFTHGVNFKVEPNKQLLSIKVDKVEEKGIAYEVDAFRFKNKSGIPVIQIVENKSLKGLTTTDYDTWLKKITIKVTNLIALQAQIKKYKEYSTVVFVKNIAYRCILQVAEFPKKMEEGILYLKIDKLEEKIVVKSTSQKAIETPKSKPEYIEVINKLNEIKEDKIVDLSAVREIASLLAANIVTPVNDQDKLKFLQMLVECKAVKFRFAASEEKLGEAFLNKLKIIAEDIGKQTGIKLSFGCGRSDAGNDGLHFINRTSKNQPRNIKTINKDLKSPQAERLYKKYDKLAQTIDELTADKYPKNCKKQKITFTEENGGSLLRSAINDYNNKGDAQKEKVLKNLARDIKNTLRDSGHTSTFTYELVFDKTGKNIEAIEVETNTSKYLLIYRAEQALQRVVSQLQSLTPSSLVIPPTSVRRNSLSKSTDVSLSSSKSNIYSESASARSSCSSSSQTVGSTDSTLVTSIPASTTVHS